MKKGLLMFTLILIAVFLGSFLGELSLGVPGLDWLGKEFSVGFSPSEIDLNLFVVTLGFQIKACICQIFLILAALLSYNKVAKLIFS